MLAEQQYFGQPAVAAELIRTRIIERNKQALAALLRQRQQIEAQIEECTATIAEWSAVLATPAQSEPQA